MPHYRKLTVEDNDYRYRVGKTHTKVITPNGTRLFENAEWGTPIRNTDWSYQEDGEDRAVRDMHKVPVSGYIVGPGDIRGMIVGERKWKDHPCKRHPDVMVNGLSFDPFESEIHGKAHFLDNCPRCRSASAQNI